MDGARTWVALIRAIGGETHARMPMAALREAAVRAGLGNPRTILATGNLVFTADGTEPDLCHLIGGILADHGLGPAQRVFLRALADLPAVAAANPFPEAARDRPSRLLVHFMAAPPGPEAAAALADWPGPERGRIVGREAYLDYAEGIGTSKLTGTRLERMLGGPGTARNWNTLTRLIAAAPG